MRYFELTITFPSGEKEHFGVVELDVDGDIFTSRSIPFCHSKIIKPLDDTLKPFYSTSVVSIISNSKEVIFAEIKE